MNYLRNLAAVYRSYNRAVRLYLAADALLGVFTGFTQMLLNFHLLSLTSTAEHVGRLQATAAFVSAATAIPVGLLAGRCGPRPFLLVGSYANGLLAAALPWLTSFPALVAVFALTGLASTLMLITEFPLLAGEVPSGRRGSLFSLVFLNFFAVNAASTLVASRLPTWLPPGPLGIYQLPLTLAGLFALGSAVIRHHMPLGPWTGPGAGGVDDGEAVTGGSVAGGEGAGGGGAVARAGRRGLRLHPALLPMAAFSALSGAAAALGWHFGNVVLKDRYSLPDTVVGPLITATGAMGAAGTLLVPAFERRFGQARGILFTLAAAVPVQLACAYAGSLWPFVAAFWLRNLFLTMQQPQAQAYMMSIVPRHTRSVMSSFSMVGFTAGIAAADRVYGHLLARQGFAAAFLFGAASTAAAAAVFWLWACWRPLAAQQN